MLKQKESLYPEEGTGLPVQEVYSQRFSVNYDYPVCFARDIFDPENGLFASIMDRRNEKRRHRAMVVLDSGVADSWPDLPEKIEAYFRGRSNLMEIAGRIEIEKGGEGIKKNWEPARRMMRAIAERRLCRQSFVVAVGGGSLLDSAGLAASLIHRGVRLIRIPTTVLAQNDAGVGVKNGVNEGGIKNFAGTFSPPFAVIDDFDFLRTLPFEHWIGGVAEAFKVAIIKDKGFFSELAKIAERLANRCETSIETVVKRCAVLHLRHIAENGDPFEFGSARPLDYGHWSAHRLETLSGYEMGHGQAVSVGIALDACYAADGGTLHPAERDEIVGALEKSGLPVWSDLLLQRTAGGELEILQGLKDFQEHLGGRLTVTLPCGIGEKVETHEMDPLRIERAVSFLRKRNAVRRTRLLLKEIDA